MSAPRIDDQDALAWLEMVTSGEVQIPEAARLGDMIRAFESRENTVLGMLMARRPAAEIRDYLLTDIPGHRP